MKPIVERAYDYADEKWIVIDELKNSFEYD